MKRDWIICDSCETEFKIMTDSLEPTCYCPFCGSEIEEESDEDDEDYE